MQKCLETLSIDFYHSFYDFMVPTVNADAGTEPKNASSTVDEDMSDDENIADDQQVKRKTKKEKIGFRDRKVLPRFFFFIYLDHNC